MTFSSFSQTFNTFSLISFLADNLTFYFTEKLEAIIKELYKLLLPLLSTHLHLCYIFCYFGWTLCSYLRPIPPLMLWPHLLSPTLLQPLSSLSSFSSSFFLSVFFLSVYKYSIIFSILKMTPHSFSMPYAFMVKLLKILVYTRNFPFLLFSLEHSSFRLSPLFHRNYCTSN